VHPNPAHPNPARVYPYIVPAGFVSPLRDSPLLRDSSLRCVTPLSSVSAAGLASPATGLVSPLCDSSLQFLRYGTRICFPLCDSSLQLLYCRTRCVLYYLGVVQIDLMEELNVYGERQIISCIYIWPGIPSLLVVSNSFLIQYTPFSFIAKLS
jgi:hypothetical protein